MVTLTGQVQDDDTLDDVTDVVKRVEGVRLVMNQMSTDDKVMSAWQFAANELGKIGDYFRRMWLLIILAVDLRHAFDRPCEGLRRLVGNNTCAVS